MPHESIGRGCLEVARLSGGRAEYSSNYEESRLQTKKHNYAAKEVCLQRKHIEREKEHIALGAINDKNDVRDDNNNPPNNGKPI